MQYTEIMVRYGELSTKGKNKKYFIKKLSTNIRQALKDFPEVQVVGNRDRLHIKLNGEDGEAIIERLRPMFGIQTFSPVVKVEKSLEAACEAAVELVKKQYKEGMSFKINTRRADHEFEFDTNEINQKMGSAVALAIPSIRIQMKQPDIVVRVEVRQRGIYLSTETIQGAGGLPVGTGGKGMLMLSGGIDSPVAGYLAQKRGLEIEAVHFHSPPYTSPQALQKAKDLAGKLAVYSGTIQFIEVPFTEIQEEIKKHVPQGYGMTINRRMMLRLTDEIRKQREGLAIVNGESIGQVASQTLESMAAINAVTNTPMIRPVVSMDKTEIIEIAEKIDTFELSVQPYEDCCTIFAPPKPKTRPQVSKAEQYEEHLDVEGLIQRALDGIKVTAIHAGETSESKEQELFASLL
ncbi:tRNA uracil 4-sulfurtransferase ThiI [Atopococcus tabaci]|uniref:tRNA uracil 4-sulfurtransferase ThiI n=1 Tax=Atopococcus tabaci TaxID=269774 RepID=UPI00041BE4C5|nr:tRNA uracil 4-sulfurtransferase ThiI [Atopococcus tabaci]